MSTFHLHDLAFLPHHGCDISLQLKPQELLVLWGENGIGKSTLLQRLYFHLLASGLSVSLVEQKPLEIFFDRTLKSVVDFFSQANFSSFHRPYLEQLLAVK